jgi:hypothetical protein
VLQLASAAGAAAGAVACANAAPLTTKDNADARTRVLSMFCFMTGPG